MESVLVCPSCRTPGELRGSIPGTAVAHLRCDACGAEIPLVNGVPDFAPHIPVDERSGVFTQRVMNTELFARIYENGIWRPLHTQLVSGRSLDEEVEDILALARPRSGQLIVDLACGTGIYARAFLQSAPGARVLGVDLSPGMLRRGVQVAAEAQLEGLTFIRADASRLPIQDGTVDLINCAGALHLFADPSPFFREMARVLKPGGVLTGMTIGWAPGPVAKLQQRAVQKGGASFYSQESLSQLLTPLGVTDVTSHQRRMEFLFRGVRHGGGAAREVAL